MTHTTQPKCGGNAKNVIILGKHQLKPDPEELGALYAGTKDLTKSEE